MFKFVALCAFLAAATAEPGAFIAPLAYSPSVVAPATTVVSSYARSPIYSSAYIPAAPLAYSAPWGYSHLIKKRSLAVSSYIAPSTYIASAPLANTYAAAPLVTTYTAGAPFISASIATTYSHPIYPTPAHLIKKRSAAFIAPSSFIAPSYVAPYAAAPSYIPSTYATAGPYVSAPLVSSAPFLYNAHLIKKRSVLQPVAAYAAPASFSHTSRFDFRTSSPAITYSSYAAAAPLAYSPLAVSRFY